MTASPPSTPVQTLAGPATAHHQTWGTRGTSIWLASRPASPSHRAIANLLGHTHADVMTAHMLPYKVHYTCCRNLSSGCLWVEQSTKCTRNSAPTQASCKRGLANIFPSNESKLTLLNKPQTCNYPVSPTIYSTPWDTPRKTPNVATRTMKRHRRTVRTVHGIQPPKTSRKPQGIQSGNMAIPAVRKFIFSPVAPETRSNRYLCNLKRESNQKQRPGLSQYRQWKGYTKVGHDTSIQTFRSEGRTTPSCRFNIPLVSEPSCNMCHVLGLGTCIS